MNFRLTAIFFGLVLALVVGLLVLVLVEGDRSPLGDETLLTELRLFKDKEIDAVELTRTPAGGGEEKLVFARAGEGKWELREPFKAKVDSALVESVVRDVMRVKPTAYGDLTDNLGIHGLDKPTYRVTLKKGEKSAGLNLGFSTLGSRPVTFVTTSANPGRSLAVLRNDILGLFRDSAGKQEGEAAKLVKWLPDFRVRKPLGSELRDPAGEVTALKLGVGLQEIALARQPGAAWAFTSPPNFGDADELGDSAVQPPNAPLTGIRPLLNAATAAQVATTEDYIEKPEDLGKYGLKPGDANALRVDLTTKAGAETLVLGNPVEVNGKPATPAKVYARLEGDSGVMMVTFDKLESLKATLRSPGELRNKDLMPEAQRGRIDAFDLTVGAATMKLRKVAVAGEATPQWVIYGGPAPAFAKTAEVEQLLTQLAKPRVAREVLSAPYDAVFAEADRRAVLRVWRSGLEGVKPPATKLEPGQFPPEPAPAGAAAEFVFGKGEGDIVYVRRTIDGKTADLKVPEQVLAAVAKTRNDWLDPKWKSFVTTAVTRVALSRGADLTDVERDAAGQWVFAKPDAMKGATADAERVEAILVRLSTVGADRVVVETPTPEDLKRLGLDPARLRVTLTLKDEADKPRVYEFGNDAEDKRAVTLQQGGKPFAMQTARGIFDLIQEADLRDTVVYRLDPAKVKRLKIRGWRGLRGAIATYQLEKSGATWTATAPPGVAIDGAKVDQLVLALARPKVDQFVGLPKAEHGVSVDANPEAMEFTLESDGAPTVALVLGNRSEGARVFATASTTPNLIGVFDASVVKRFTEKPELLHK